MNINYKIIVTISPSGSMLENMKREKTIESLTSYTRLTVT